MSKLVSFIEQAPLKKVKACANCIYFTLWGVHTGQCSAMNKDKMDFNVCRKYFKYKTNE